ncbi:MAG: hypothetical protein AAFQ77_02170 [Myxococcota bacterium]
MPLVGTGVGDPTFNVLAGVHLEGPIIRLHDELMFAQDPLHRSNRALLSAKLGCFPP